MNYPSSSESECEILYQNSIRTNSYRGTPFYTAFGHPLIYYAEIKPKRRRNGENEKNKSNCFVKAFRWYTQEHIPFKSNKSPHDVNDADMNGFATWLDEKYNEYLQASSIDRNQCILSQASTLQVVNVTEKFDNKRTSRKFPRIKSPWRKRAKSLIEDKTCFTARSNQSIKVILKSKTLSRAASACCQRCDFQTRSKSEGSVVSDTSALRTKLQPICKSLTSGFKEREVYVIPIDILQDRKKDKEGNINEIIRNDRKDIKQIFPKRESSSSAKLTQQKEDVYCRCSSKPLRNIEASNKFNKKLTNICQYYERKAKQEIAVISETCTNTKYRTSTAVPGVTSESVQTSDYSINLENDITHKCPLFVKIICANKLKDNCNC